MAPMGNAGRRLRLPPVPLTIVVALVGIALSVAGWAAANAQQRASDRVRLSAAMNRTVAQITQTVTSDDSDSVPIDTSAAAASSPGVVCCSTFLDQ